MNRFFYTRSFGKYLSIRMGKYVVIDRLQKPVQRYTPHLNAKSIPKLTNWVPNCAKLTMNVIYNIKFEQ